MKNKKSLGLISFTIFLFLIFLFWTKTYYCISNSDGYKHKRKGIEYFPTCFFNPFKEKKLRDKLEKQIEQNLYQKVCLAEDFRVLIKYGHSVNYDILSIKDVKDEKHVLVRGDKSPDDYTIVLVFDTNLENLIKCY